MFLLNIFELDNIWYWTSILYPNHLFTWFCEIFWFFWTLANQEGLIIPPENNVGRSYKSHAAVYIILDAASILICHLFLPNNYACNNVCNGLAVVYCILCVCLMLFYNANNLPIFYFQIFIRFQLGNLYSA